jgi:hypothetical protein
MMKAGLVTFSTAPNFGAFFQSLASTRELWRRGFSVRNYDPNQLDYYTRTTWRPQSFVYRAQAKSYHYDRELVALECNWIGCDLTNSLSDLNAIFIGSDQVLNLNCIQGRNLDRVLLPMIRNIPKFGWAMSTYSTQDLDMIATNSLQELANFSRNSFRENTIASRIFDRTGIVGEIIPDPCFLFSQEDLEEYAQISTSKPRVLATLVAGYDLRSWATELIKSVNPPEPVGYVNYQYKQAVKFGLFTKGPLHALKELLQAEVILTNSFHFAVLGIVANKTVIVQFDVGHDGGNRLRNLVKLLQFEESLPRIFIYRSQKEKCKKLAQLQKQLTSYMDKCLIALT